MALRPPEVPSEDEIARRQRMVRNDVDGEVRDIVAVDIHIDHLDRACRHHPQAGIRWNSLQRYAAKQYMRKRFEGATKSSVTLLNPPVRPSWRQAASVSGKSEAWTWAAMVSHSASV